MGALKNEFPDIKYYPAEDGKVKLPAAWLIEHAGLKGIERNGAGTHKAHALVLINYDNASGEQVLAVSNEPFNSFFRFTTGRDLNLLSANNSAAVPTLSFGAILGICVDIISAAVRVSVEPDS